MQKFTSEAIAHVESQNPNRSIFREQAVRSYVESRERAVLPRLICPRTFIYLWLLVGLLAVSSIFTWFAIKPVFTDFKHDERVPS